MIARFRCTGRRLAVSAVALLAGVAMGQTADAEDAPKPVTFTTEEDHANMMEQLGISALRPGPSGRADAPNAANYDESIANPFPDWPEILVAADGEPVTTAAAWWEKRRPEILEDLEREVIGRVPDGAPEVTWVVIEEQETTVGDVPVVRRTLQGQVDNSAAPSIEVNIAATLTVPRDAAGPVPALMMFSFGFGRRGGGPLPSHVQLLSAGWAVATIPPNSIQADNGAGLTRGVIGLTNRGQPRTPEQWGSLRAWAWGASRFLDYLETEPNVDATKVGIEGVSRYGKAALVTMATDPRFAVVLIGSAGEGGVSPYRRNFGEAVENLTGRGEYHWMAGNFLKYGAAEASFGSKNAGDLPVDAHSLIALCAPRPTFISYGVPERGDALWLDQLGSYRAGIAASEAFRLLGAKTFGSPSDDYRTATMPPVNEGLLDGALAWRQHDGGHTDGPNIPHFIEWADRMLDND